MPQSPELATQIYEAAAETNGWHDPKRDIQPDALALVMARALGDYTAVVRLSAAAERHFEPRWFGEDMEKFGWWFNYGEPGPRGAEHRHLCRRSQCGRTGNDLANYQPAECSRSRRDL